MSTFKTSSVRLYKVTTSDNWELLPHKLFVVDSIEDYLGTKTYDSIAAFQYQKPQLELSITCDLSQTYAEPLNTSYKYVRIENSDDTGKYYYYFVKNVIWRSKSAVRFDLVMDVLNTFKEGTHYHFKANTNILREHKDRYIVHEDHTIVTLVCEVLNEDWYPAVNDEPTIKTYPSAEELAQVQVLEADTQTAIWTLKLNVLQGDLSGLQRGDNINIVSENNENAIVSVDSLTPLKDFYRNIDYYPENISPILQCGNAEGTKLEDKSPLNVDWFLLYRNENDPDESLVNPVECYLVPSTSLKVSTGVLTSGAITSGTLENNKYYYLNLRNNGITLSNGITFARYLFYNDFAIVKKQDNGLLSVTCCSGGVGGTYDLENVDVYNDIEYITLLDLPQPYKANTVQYDVYTYISTILGNETDSWTGTEVEQVIDNVASIDKTDAKNIKLIKLPYCPYGFTITGGKIDLITSNWNYEALTQDNGTIHLLKLYDMRTKLENNISSTSIAPFSPLAVADFTPSINDLRQTALDSKMYNSEFYRGTFVYDSFAFYFQLEKCNLDYYIANPSNLNRIDCKFLVTSTINSKFLMKFTSYKVKYSNENYHNVMPVAINNEEVLYNVPYINWIRTGYNYEVKNKNISTGLTWASVGAGAVGMGVSLALPSVPLKVAGIVTSAIGMLVTIFNAVATTQKNEMSLDQKKRELQNQSSSVVGSDDVDLRSEYTENRFKYLVYEPTPVMKSLINDLFFYGGYATNKMAVPTHNNRVNFDFLQCNAEIEKVGNMPDECLSELINCFKTGVTYLHKTDRTSKKWDFAQEFENWEVSLMED